MLDLTLALHDPLLESLSRELPSAPLVAFEVALRWLVGVHGHERRPIVP